MLYHTETECGGASPRSPDSGLQTNGAVASGQIDHASRKDEFDFQHFGTAEGGSRLGHGPEPRRRNSVEECTCLQPRLSSQSTIFAFLCFPRTVSTFLNPQTKLRDYPWSFSPDKVRRGIEEYILYSWSATGRNQRSTTMVQATVATSLKITPCPTWSATAPPVPLTPWMIPALLKGRSKWSLAITGNAIALAGTSRPAGGLGRAWHCHGLVGSIGGVLWEGSSRGVRSDNRADVDSCRCGCASFLMFESYAYVLYLNVDFFNLDCFEYGFCDWNIAFFVSFTVMVVIFSP